MLKLTKRYKNLFVLSYVTTYFDQLRTLKKNQSALNFGPSQRPLNFFYSKFISAILSILKKNLHLHSYQCLHQCAKFGKPMSKQKKLWAGHKSATLRSQGVEKVYNFRLMKK